MKKNTPDIPQEVISATQEWLEKAVIGLNLCPFAKSVHVQKRIRYYVSQAKAPNRLAEELASELRYLQNADAHEYETTLLIHPYVLTDFLDFNDFLDTAESVITQLQLEGEFQIASFHPDYQFAGTQANDIENYTNRSPFPTLHLLRESSIERAVAAIPNTEQIYEKNMHTLRQLDHAGWQRLFIAT